jgi:type II secretory pathway component PulM
MKGVVLYLSKLTLRERVLAGMALVLAGCLGVFYGLYAPGLAASASAQSRYDRAAADLAEARDLARLIAPRAPVQQDLEALKALASERGLHVASAVISEGSAVLSLSSSSAPAVLAWAAAASEGVLPLRSLSVRREGAGELTIEAAFSGTGT